MRTATLTSPKEIVPLQIGLGMAFPVPVFGSRYTRKETDSKKDWCPSKSFSTQRGGRLFGPDFRPEVVLERLALTPRRRTAALENRGISLWMLWRGALHSAQTSSRTY